MNRSPNLFDIGSSEALFYAIQRSVDKLQSQKAKETDRLLFIMLGLTHLREWIAPGYSDIPKQKRKPQKPEDDFFELIETHPEFNILRSICNHSKHLKHVNQPVSTEYDLPFDEWPNVDDVQNVDEGPPTKYCIDGTDIMEIINHVITFYSTHWFSKL